MTDTKDVEDANDEPFRKTHTNTDVLKESLLVLELGHLDNYILRTKCHVLNI